MARKRKNIPTETENTTETIADLTETPATEVVSDVSSTEPVVEETEVTEPIEVVEIVETPTEDTPVTETEVADTPLEETEVGETIESVEEPVVEETTDTVSESTTIPVETPTETTETPVVTPAEPTVETDDTTSSAPASGVDAGLALQYASDIKSLFKAFAQAYKKEERTLENFKAFLKQQNLSTVHAEDFINLYNKNKKIIVKADNVDIRKMHDQRDWWIKKVGVPTAITATAFGITSIVAAASSVGSQFMGGMMTLSGTGLDTLFIGLSGAVFGAAITPVVIIAKNKLIKLGMRGTYGTAAKNLKQLEDGVSIENIKLNAIFAKIQEAEKTILLSKQVPGNKSRLKRTWENIWNRDRIHHLEDVTVDLIKKRLELENSTDEKDIVTLANVDKLLRKIENFVVSDVVKLKYFELLTCQETSEHEHKMKFENVDIYSNLRYYIATITEKIHESQKTSETTVAPAAATVSTESSTESTANTETTTTSTAQPETKKVVLDKRIIAEATATARSYSKVAAQKKEEAVKLINDERLLPKTMLSRITGLVEVTSFALNDDGSVVFTTDNGSTVTVTADQISNNGIVASQVATIRSTSSTHTLITTSNEEIKISIQKTSATAGVRQMASHGMLDLLGDTAYTATLLTEGFTIEEINKLTERLKKYQQSATFKKGSKPSIKDERIKTLYSYIETTAYSYIAASHNTEETTSESGATV